MIPGQLMTQNIGSLILFEEKNIYDWINAWQDNCEAKVLIFNVLVLHILWMCEILKQRLQKNIKVSLMVTYYKVWMAIIRFNSRKLPLKGLKFSEFNFWLINCWLHSCHIQPFQDTSRKIISCQERPHQTVSFCG